MTQASRRTIAVIGGGITGLCAARRLAQLDDSADVVVFERETKPGGKLRTLELEGCVVEAGADSFLARDSRPAALCHELGLADELEKPALFGALLWQSDSLVPVPQPGAFGIPASASAAWRARALSPFGRLRAAGEVLSPRRLSGPDVSVARFVRRRLGREVLERVVDPVLAGTRAGDPGRMSLAAALPSVDAAARSHRSVIAGLRGQIEPHGAAPPFWGLRRGMAVLTDRLAAGARVRVRTGTDVRRLERRAEGYAVLDADGDATAVAGVLVATPAFDAARLLAEIAPGAARILRTFSYATVASVALLYRTGDLRIPPETSGVLVGSKWRRAVSAATWVSRKWPHSTARGLEVVRCFVGRSDADAVPEDDDALAALCADDVARFTSSSARPSATLVTRWPRGLPQYEVGHLDRVALVDDELSSHPRIAIAGAGYRGSGLPDCIADAERAAAGVAASLARDHLDPDRARLVE